MNLPDAVVKFCAEEVGRQKEPTKLVFNYLKAWEDAIELRKDLKWIHPEMIKKWGQLTEPEVNDGEWRYVPVFVGNHRKMEAMMIPQAMKNLCNNLDTLDPASAYKEFQDIHPFRNGNGRVGKIIFNWMKGTLNDPKMPPNFWGTENP